MRAPETDDSLREDAALVERIRANPRDQEACRLLVSKYWRLLVLWVRPRLPDPSEAEDVVQEAFIRALKAIRALEDVQRFVPWLLRIAMNRAADLARRRRPDRSLESLEGDGTRPGLAAAPEEDLGRGLDQDEQYRSVLRAVERLPEKYRAVILLRYFEGMPGNKIAAALGEPEGTIRNRLFRAHQKIRNLVRSFSPAGRPGSGTEGGRS